MHKVIDELQIKGNTILTLDNPRPLTDYKKYLIDGSEYKPIHITNSPRCIAISKTGDFIGKTVEFN